MKQYANYELLMWPSSVHDSDQAVRNLELRGHLLMQVNNT